MMPNLKQFNPENELATSEQSQKTNDLTHLGLHVAEMEAEKKPIFTWEFDF